MNCGKEPKVEIQNFNSLTAGSNGSGGDTWQQGNGASLFPSEVASPETQGDFEARGGDKEDLGSEEVHVLCMEASQEIHRTLSRNEAYQNQEFAAKPKEESWKGRGKDYVGMGT